VKGEEDRGLMKMSIEDVKVMDERKGRSVEFKVGSQKSEVRSQKFKVGTR